MDKPQILLVERHRSAHPSFASALRKRYSVTSVMSGKQALASAEALQPAALIIDAISLNSPGDRIARMLKSEQSAPVIHLAESLERSDADVLLKAPVSTRRLNATLDRLIAPHKTSAHDALVVGPFHMDMVRRVLIVEDRQTQLTPKLALLVEVFLRNPGATLDRKQLMERVWQTDYLGDTRTLDVHIRWIRRAIEADPARPRYLKTVRGIGYRLELPAQPAKALHVRGHGRSRK
jgi:DNA-binding response OmpR family regulator